MVWKSAYPTFVEDWKNAQTSGKMNQFWTKVASLTGYANAASVKNKYYTSLNKWIKAIVKLQGPNSTGEGEIDYKAVTKISNRSNKEIKDLMDQYMVILESNRKLSPTNSNYSKAKTKLTGPQAIVEYTKVKKHGIDSLNNSNVLEAKKMKYEHENTKTLMEQLKLASEQRRLAQEHREDDNVQFWTAQEATLREKIQNH